MEDVKLTNQKLYNGVHLCDGPDLDNVAKIDMGALPMVHRMARTGLPVDLNHFSKMERVLSDDMDDITEKVKDITGYRINIDSGDQVADLLFKKLGLKQLRPLMTASGSRESVVDEVLTAIQHEHPVVTLIQDYKEFSKLLGTYARPMSKLAKKTKFGEWRMFPNFTVTRVPSGRLACKEPNLLAMPNRTKRGKELCMGFIAPPGWVYLGVDLSQIEPRVAAHLSRDENLMEVYHTGQDIYSDFATTAFKLKDERFNDGSKWRYPTVDKEEHRRPSKTCILGAIYDVSAKGLVAQMPVVCANCKLEATKHNCSKFEALWNEDNCQDLITAFYIKYYGILVTRKKHHAIARRLAYIYSMWGRILHATAVRSALKWVVSSALREVANFNYQEGAQGVIKLSQAQLEDDFVDMKIYGDTFNPVLQIHDEILGLCRQEMAEEVGQHIIFRMENIVRLAVPLKASMAMSNTWGEMQK